MDKLLDYVKEVIRWTLCPKQFCILTMVALCIVSVADADELYTSITEMRASADERLCEVYALYRNYFTKACKKPWIGLS